MKNYFLPVLILLTSCFNSNDKGGDETLARVYKDYLNKAEIRHIIPPGTSERDSALIVKNFINNWISEKLILYKAQKNLRKEDLHFEKQLEEYRNSLVIYKYESHLIRQKLDTVVTDMEIEKYYYDNIGNFQLKDNIVKVYYARFDSSIPEISKIRRFFHSNSPEHRDSLEKYIEKFSDFYYLDDETWILFDDINKYLPLDTYNQETYLQNNRKIELNEDPLIYFVNFTDFIVKDGESPLSFEKENIRQIIINKRKLQIISQMREEIFQAALNDNDFEIY